MESNISKKYNFFNSLQIFRGFAALFVVFHHQWVAFEHFYGVNNDALHFLASLGKNGVDFFFVLSGFIITYSNYEKHGNVNHIKSYFLNRAFRIYIPFLPISFIMVLLYFIFPHVSEGDRSISLLTSLTLIPDGRPALSVAWTLIHEMMFYIFFLSWFFSKNLWFTFVGLWGLIIVYFNYSGSIILSQNPLFQYFISPYNLEFIIGFLCAVFVKKVKNYSKTTFLISSIVILIIVSTFKYLKVVSNVSVLNLGFSIGFAFLILGGIGSWLDKYSNQNVLMKIGNASYSIYLVHNPLISIFVRVFKFIPLNLPILLIYFAIFFLCCFIGYVYSKVFETAVLNLFKRKFISHRKVILAYS